MSRSDDDRFIRDVSEQEAEQASTFVARRPVAAPDDDDLQATLVTGQAAREAGRAPAPISRASAPASRRGPAPTVRLSDLAVEATRQPPPDSYASTLVAKNARSRSVPGEEDVTVPAGAPAPFLAPMNVPSDTLVASSRSPRPLDPAAGAPLTKPSVSAVHRGRAFAVVAVLIVVLGLLWGLR